jgi:hypothetical protein
MALGAMRTLYQITGDDDIGAFYYDDLIDARGYMQSADTGLALVYFGTGTNYSNVNMAFVAMYPLLRYEPEPDVAHAARTILAEQLYRDMPGKTARGLQQSFFDLIVAGFDTQGATGIGATALTDAMATLVGHPDAPYWDDAVQNCDEGELAAQSCIALDGSTLTIAGQGWNDEPVADAPLPIAIRPPSNFAWRSNPHDVNGGGSTRLDPGGDIHCAYWMGRMLAAGSDGLANISGDARGRPQPGGSGSSEGRDPDTSGGYSDSTTTDTGRAASTSSASDHTTTAGADASSPEGCGCTSHTRGIPWWFAVLVLLSRSRVVLVRSRATGHARRPAMRARVPLRTSSPHAASADARTVARSRM